MSNEQHSENPVTDGVTSLRDEAAAALDGELIDDLDAPAASIDQIAGGAGVAVKTGGQPDGNAPWK